MRLVSDEILIDTDAQEPVHEAIYPSYSEFELWNPSSWTGGHPFDLYKKMRENAPVMWSPTREGFAGFWAVSRYEDIRRVELAADLFSSERGSINISIPERKDWKPDKLIPASLNSLINLDAQRHLEMRLQQKKFFLPPEYIAQLREKVGVKV
ncbi:MAG: cytochrome P450, partial [Halieaceae bacterium]|nr:cytochrome P450 [Halieaceae bacterium]